MELQKFKLGANAFLLDVDGLQFTLYHTGFKNLRYFSTFLTFGSTFTIFSTDYLFLLLFSYFFSMIFSLLIGLSSLLVSSGFWHQALPVGVCSLECDDDDDDYDGDDDDDGWSGIKTCEKKVTEP